MMGEHLMRRKKRYLALKVHGVDDPAAVNVFELVAHAVKEIFGDLGLAETELSWVRTVGENSVTVLRCAEDQVEKVRFATLFLKKIDGEEAGLTVVKTSGTVKGALKRR